MFIRDRIGLLLGGVLPDGTRSSFTSITHTKVCAYLHRCGMNIRVYNDDPHSTLGVPRELDDDLEKGILKSLLTIQSNFGYRYLKSERWRSHAIPHVDIGAVPTGFQVDVDRASFITMALAHARSTGRKKLAVVSRGTGMQIEDLQKLCGHRDTRLLTGSDLDLHRDASREAWGFALGQQTFTRGNLPDALVVAEASIAKGLVQAGLVHQVSIPGRVKVITLLNKPEDMFFPQPVTRFTVDLETLACTAGQMLIDLTRNVAIASKTQLIKPQLESE
jgi:DNA-binding LacI/PurR family transcriptional regulator